MRKAWVVFGLVLLISIQLSALSLFHGVTAYGVTYGDSEVHIVKFDYVAASVQVTISNDKQGGSLAITLPNGTRVQTSSTYVVSLSLPRTGDFGGNGGMALSNSVSVDRSSPIVAWVDANVTSPTGSGYGGPIGSNLDVTTILVTGDGSVYITGYGVAV